MAREHVQTDSAAACGIIAACSSATMLVDAVDMQCVVGGTPGTTENVVAIPTGGVLRGTMVMQSGPVGLATWPAGSWVVRLNITTAQADTALRAVHICRVTSGCASVATIASETGLNVALSGGGIFTRNLTGIEHTRAGGENDAFYIVLVMSNAHTHTTRNVGITPNQTITSPFPAPAVSLTPNSLTHAQTATSPALTLPAPTGVGRMQFTDTLTAYAGIPSDPAFNTNAMEIRLDIALASWSVAGDRRLIARWGVTTGTRHWSFALGIGHLRFFVADNAHGAFSHGFSRPFTAPAAGERLQLRLRFEPTEARANFWERRGAAIESDLTTDTGWTSLGFATGAAVDWAGTTQEIRLLGQAFELHGDVYRAVAWSDLTKTTKYIDLDFVTEANLVTPGNYSVWDDKASANDWTIVGTEGVDWVYVPGAAAVSLTPESLSHGQAAEDPAASQTHALVPSDLTHAQTTEEPASAQRYNFLAEALSHAPALTAAALAVTYSLVPAGLAHAQSLEEPAASAVHALAPDSLSHGQTLDEAGAVQAHALAADTLTQGQAVDSAAIDVGAIGLAPDAVTHAQALEQVAGVQAHLLAAEGASHGQAVDQAALAQAHALGVEALAHGHLADPTTLAITVQLEPADLTHGQATDLATLSQVHTLAAEAATHGQAADAAAAVQTQALTPNGLLHGHALGQPELPEAGPQFGRPAADVAVGGWTVAPLWEKVDEGAPGDDVTIISGNNTSPDNADFALSAVTNPGVDTGHILRAAWHKDAAAGHVINAVLELWQGVPGTGTLIATLSVAGISEIEQQDSYTLTPAEADSVTDYSALHLRLSRQGDTGGGGATRRSLVVDYVELEVPVAAPVISLTPDDLTHGQTTDAAQVSEIPALVPGALSHAQATEEAQALQLHLLAASSAVHAQAVDQAAVAQIHALSPDGLAHAQQVDSAAGAQVHALAAEQLAHAQATEEAGVAQAHQLAAGEVAHAQAADDVALAQAHAVAPEAASHGQTLGAAVLETGALVFAVDDLAHGQSVEAAGLAQAHVITADPAAHGQAVSETALGAVVALMPDDLAHGQNAESPALDVVVGVVLTPEALAHGQAVHEPAPLQLHNLAPAAALHVQIIGSAQLGGAPPPEGATGPLSGRVESVGALQGSAYSESELRGRVKTGTLSGRTTGEE